VTNKPSALQTSLFSALLVFAVSSANPLCYAQTTTPSIVISQIYGGGGNSGATYKNDFIELFNATASARSLAGYSVQYASSTGTSYQVTALPSVTLQPGEFFLVQEAPGAGGTVSLPAPDVNGNINMSATSGKVALVSSTTALSGACPTSNASIVDYVGFGTAANCSLGSGPTATLTNTTAALRTPVCKNTPSNAADFTTGAPIPRNTGTALQPCSTLSGVSLSASAVATPATVYAGTQTLLTVTVTPATQPASTGIQVNADLSSVSGSSSQPFYDDGSHGDVTAGDNVFSYALTPSTSGMYTLPVTVTDAQLRSVSKSIALAVQTAPPIVSIRSIQSAKPSPYSGQTITTTGIVVGVRSSGFYLEAADADTNPVTPEGILIYTGSSAKPSYITVGALVQVTGKIASYPSTSLTPDTEFDAPLSFSLISSGNTLPAPVQLTAAQDSPSGGLYQFAKYEGMRVSIASLTTTGPTDASLNEQTETQTSNGQFFGVVAGVPRPFREPGISVNDLTYGPIPAGIPVWDSNPELLLIDSASFGGTALDVTSNATVTGLTGVMDFSTGGPDILLDANDHPVVTGLLTPQPLPAKSAGEFTVASFNMERFYNDIADADNPGSSVVVVTTSAYQRRLAKASLAIRTILNNPDIIGAQEIENLNVLTDLANKVNTDSVNAGLANPQYQPYLFLANDGTGINTGFLVKSTTVDTLNVQQVGLNTTFTNSVGQQAILNDRTPLVLHAGIKRAGGADYPVTVIDVHQRSLINVDDPTSTGATVRLKREAQAEFLAQLIQSYQANGEHVVTVGDYNSFQFSDGFVDVLGVTKGNPVPANQVVTPPTPNLVTPNLIDLDTLQPAGQYSYVEVGSAQYLDHVLITQDLLPTFDRLNFAHIDADFPLVDENDASVPARISDHDPALAYFALPPIAGTINLQTSATLTTFTGGYQERVTVTNVGSGIAPNVTITSATLGSATSSTIPAVLGDLAPNTSVTYTLSFPASAGADHAATIERLAGTYTGGNFSSSQRATLP
jgi:predicted extracellular nuclease